LTAFHGLSKFRQVTILLGAIGAVYIVSLVFVIALFARTLWREHAAPLRQSIPLQRTAEDTQGELHPATKTA